jgi:hypothetical protein
MIAYLTKQFQAVPALMAIYREIGGHFVTTRSNTVKAIKQNNPQASVIKYTEKLGKFSSGYKVLNKSDAIVTGGPYRNILSRFGARKYMIFTGTTPALTAQEIQEDHAHFDKLCAIGPRMLRTIEKSGVNVEVTQTGYFPFLYFPERNSEKRRAHLESVELDADKKNVVYLPRGKPNGSFDLMMPNFLQELPKVSFNFIVRPHPSQSVKLHLRDRLFFLSMQKQIKQHRNVFLDLNHFRLSDLLSMADLVITDGNSPAEESLFYDTPQLLVETERLSRKSISKTMRINEATEEDIELALRIYENGPIITPDDKDLSDLIERAMADASQYAKARSANFEFVFGERDFKRQHALIDELRAFAS